MSAIKRLGNRVAERSFFRIIENHRCPCDGLERQPLQAYRTAKRDNRHAASNETKHGHETRDALLPRQFILGRAYVSDTTGSNFREAILLILRLRLRFPLPRQFSFNLQLK